MPTTRDGPQPAIKLVGLRRVYGERSGARGRRPGARRRGARWSSSAPTAPARRRCCASSRRCCGRPAARSAVLGCELPGEAWKLRGQDRLPRPRAAALPRPHRPREPALPRQAARDHRRGRRRPDRGAARGGELRAPRRRAHLRVLRRDAPAARDLPLRPARAGAAAARRARLEPRHRGPRDRPRADRAGRGHTRVVVTHDPERFLPEADQVLRLGIDEAAVDAA